MGRETVPAVPPKLTANSPLCADYHRPPS